MGLLSALQPTIYVQVAPERLVLKNIKTGETLSEVPEMAISLAPGKKVILAIGPQARVAAAGQPAELLNPFTHPRSLVSDFVLAEVLLRHQIRRLCSKQWFLPAPVIVMHPLGMPEGGFTQVELRAFRELAMGSGAAEVFLWTGRPLTDEEMRARKPMSGDWLH